jgi:predicted small secreted protein
MRRLPKIALWCLLIALGTYACGCHTIHGVGEDIEQAGRAIEHATR